MDWEDLIALGALGVLAWLIWNDFMTNANNSNLPDATGDSGASAPDVGQDSTAGPSPFVPAGSPDVSGSASAANSFDRIQQWANAIFHFEGGNPGDKNVRNNNPGNLKGSGFAGQTGTDSGGFAVFSSMDAGFQALYSDLQAKVQLYPNYSLVQIMQRYLGQNPLQPPQVTDQGDPQGYADYIAGQLGVSSSNTLQQIFGG